MGNLSLLARLLETTPEPGAAAPWAGELRDGGRAVFEELGLPNRRVEAWKYSDLALALTKTLAPTETAIQPLSIPGAFVAAFENGVFMPAASNLPASLVTPLSAVLADKSSPFAGQIGKVNAQKDHSILSLNAAHLAEGFVLRVPAGQTLEAPLHIRSNWTGKDAHGPRHLRFLVVIEDGASATLVESHSGAPGLSTVVTELRLAPKAEFTHIRLEQLTDDACQSAVALGEVDRAARYKGFYLSEGAHFCRHEALFELAGEEADVSIDGAFLATGKRHCDNTTVITHAAPNTTSQQAFRGVLCGDARGVYQGCVKVRPEAQGTDAKQMSRALLLSDDAEIATKPELEIFADDVKCSHGATAGEIDGDALFFLRSRGIPEAEARALLVEAFLSEALETIENEGLRALAATAVQDWLGAHMSEVSNVV